jgi:hypothetical protein
MKRRSENERICPGTEVSQKIHPHLELFPVSEPGADAPHLSSYDGGRRIVS